MSVVHACHKPAGEQASHERDANLPVVWNVFWQGSSVRNQIAIKQIDKSIRLQNRAVMGECDGLDKRLRCLWEDGLDCRTVAAMATEGSVRFGRSYRSNAACASQLLFYSQRPAAMEQCGRAGSRGRSDQLNTVPGPYVIPSSIFTLYPQLLPACSHARAPT